MAPLQVDPHAYLKPHHPAGRCRRGWRPYLLNGIASVDSGHVMAAS